MNVRVRRTMLTSLVAVFLVQTWMVWTDPAGRDSTPLSEAARAGWAIWHRHNCQACHQIYGFGGFLGPDLTNAAPRLTPARLDPVLTTGTGRMPAFHLTAAERAELLAFLAEVDRTGTGQARAPTLREPRALLKDLVRGGATESDALTPEEERGLSLVTEQNCFDCHLPNATSAYRAADLTLAHERLGAAGIAQALQRGVPGKAMPVMPFDETDRAAVVALLARLFRHGDAIRGGFDSAANAASGTFASLPWFEYPRPAPAAGARH